MTILITGIDGFIGSYLHAYFEDEGHHVFGITRRLSSEKEPAKRAVFELPNPEVLGVIQRLRPDLVVHAAGTASVPQSIATPYVDFSVSVPGTAQLLDSLRLHAPQAHFVFLSSAAVYGNPVKLPITESDPVRPISPYGYHKRMGELLCEEYSSVFGLKTSIIRIFSAYGGGLKKQVVFELTRKMKEAKEQGAKHVDVLGTGRESRDFIHVRDLVEMIALLPKQKQDFDVFNAGCGKEILISELVNTLCEELRFAGEIRYSGHVRKGDPINWRADISKMESLGFRTKISLRDSLQEIIAQK